MINKVILIGNIGAKPEIRKTQNGDNVASFTIATNENWKASKDNNKPALNGIR